MVGGGTAYGVAIGIRYKNWGISLARENENGESTVDNLDTVNGLATFDVRQPFKAKTWMLEIDHRRSINDHFDWISLVGIGHTEIILEDNQGVVIAVGNQGVIVPGTVIPIGPHSSESAIAYRLGGGIGYKIFDKLVFKTILQVTDIGTITRQIADAVNADGNRGVSTDSRVFSLSARLQYAF